MTALNGEIAKQGGLLATLNKGFASNQSAIAGVIRALNGLGSGYSGFGQSMGQSLASMSGFALSASNGAQGASALNGTLRVLTSTAALTVAGFAAVGATVWAFASATTEAHDRVSLLQQRFAVLSGSTEAG